MASTVLVKYPLLVKVGSKYVEIGALELEAKVSPQGNLKAPTEREVRKALKKVKF